jgi:hypothetical protein
MGVLSYLDIRHKSVFISSYELYKDSASYQAMKNPNRKIFNKLFIIFF